MAAGILLFGASACSALNRIDATATPAASEAEECENDFYPMVQGASWTYVMSGGSSGQFTRTVTGVNPGGFTDEDSFSTGAAHVRNWRCDDDSLTAMQPDEGGTAPLQIYDRMQSFQSSAVDGVTIPDQFIPGATWNEEMLLEGTGSVNGQAVPAKDAILFECHAGNVEAVTVPAGTFQAIRGNCKFDEKLTLTVGGAPQTSEVVTMTTVWYASRVGLVKGEQAAADGQKTTVELTAYKIP